MSAAATRDQLRALLGPVVSAAGMDLEDVTVTPAGRRRVLRVVVDADGGVSLDEVAAVSQRVSDALDAADPLGGGAYTLEVTSPGVDRPLVAPRQWRRACGRLVRVSVTGGGEVSGRVLGVDDGGVVFDVGGRQVRHGFDVLGRGRVQVEFRRPDGDPAEDPGEDPGEDSAGQAGTSP